MATTSLNPFSNSATLRTLREHKNQLNLRKLYTILAKTTKAQRLIGVGQTGLNSLSYSATLRSLPEQLNQMNLSERI